MSQKLATNPEHFRQFPCAPIGSVRHNRDMSDHSSHFKLVLAHLIADKAAVARAQRKIRQLRNTGGRRENDDDDALAEVAEAVFCGRSDWQATTAVAKRRGIPQRRIYRKFKERRAELLAAVDPRQAIARALWPSISQVVRAGGELFRAATEASVRHGPQIDLLRRRLYDALAKLEHK